MTERQKLIKKNLQISKWIFNLGTAMTILGLIGVVVFTVANMMLYASCSVALIIFALAVFEIASNYRLAAGRLLFRGKDW